MHVRVTHCLSNGWHVQVKLTLLLSWMTSQAATETTVIFLSSSPLIGSTDHLKWVMTCPSGLWANVPLKLAAGKDFFCPASWSWQGKTPVVKTGTHPELPQEPGADHVGSVIQEAAQSLQNLQVLFVFNLYGKNRNRADHENRQINNT